MQRTRGRPDYDYDVATERRTQDSYGSRDYDYDSRTEARYQEIYRSLCIYNINRRVPSEDIQEYLISEYHRFGEFNVKVVNAQSGDQRLAFLNFRQPEDARAAKHAKKSLQDFLGPYVRMEPVYKRLPRSPSPTPYVRENYSSYGGSQYRSREPRESSQYSYSEYDQMYSDLSAKAKDHKFPYHLNHIPPEDDLNATRTLFIGNVDHEIGEHALRDIFERYGKIEEIDIKRPSQGNAFAFIKFVNVDMAHRAKVDMSGRYIGRYQCKIGYGKPTPTNCLWIGGLGHWVKLEELEREFDRFGAISRIEWPSGKGYAYVVFETIDAASSACKEMKGFPLGGPDHRIRVDFTDESYLPSAKNSTGKEDSHKVEQRNDRTEEPVAPVAPDSTRNRRSTNSDHVADKVDCRPSEQERYSRRDREDYDRASVNSDRRKSESGYKNRVAVKRTPPASDDEGFKSRNSHEPSKRRRTRSNSSGRESGRDAKCDSKRTPKVSAEQQVNVESMDSLVGVIKTQPVVWSGALVLKNSAFATKMHLVSGDVHLVDTLMRDQSSTELPLLKITQRLRLDQPKLEEVGRRVTVSGTNGHAVLLAQPGLPDAVEDANANVQQRPLKNLVTYLKQKEAAGVISLPPNPGRDSNVGVLHAFPPCSFGQEFLTKKFPKLGTDVPKEDHLVVIVVKGAA